MHEFLQTLCSNFGSKLLRFRDIAGFVSQMPVLHIYPSSFTQNFDMFPTVRSRSMGSVPFSRDVVLENINLFNQGART